jgi:ATP-dependent exoDNAse (exonuclease V) beta subunit
VIDQARAWTDAGGGNLRQYLRWVDLQSAEGARVAESVLPETDDDAVRVMTIHAAKGLEFPITIVSGMSTVPAGRRAPAEVVFPPSGGVGYRFGRSVTTEEYLGWAPIDEQMNLHERIRLLYVACTRARDHLIVSLHRKDRVNAPARGARTNAELLVAGMGDRADELPDAVASGGVESPAGGDRARAAPARSIPLPPDPPPPFEEWAAEMSQAIALASRPATVGPLRSPQPTAPLTVTRPAVAREIPVSSSVHGTSMLRRG